MLNKHQKSALTYRSNNNYGRVERVYWTRRKWFTLVLSFLLCWIGIYLFSHSAENWGYKYANFSTQQIQQINSILHSKEMGVVHDESGAPAHSTLTTLQDQSASTASTPVKPKIDNQSLDKAVAYIETEFGDKIDKGQITVIKDYLRSFGPFETGMFLANKKLKVKDYFWLAGPAQYIETIFWSVIGVLCSILFAIGIDIKENPVRRHSRYYGTLIPYDLAKILFAPFIGVVVLLSFNLVRDRNILEGGTNEGMIIFAFTIGVFSGSVMYGISRIKDLALPKNKMEYRSYKSIPAEAYIPQEALPARESVALKLPPKKEIARSKKVSRKRPAQERSFAEPYMPPSNMVTTSTEKIREVKVDLKLDIRGLFEDERIEILRGDFRDAMITLHNINTRDIYTLKRIEDSPYFNIENIKPGIYIVRATLTQRLVDDYEVNLFGEKTVFITHENFNIELYLKKYEALA